MTRSTIKFHMEKFGILPTHTTWVDHVKEYKNVMANRVNTAYGFSALSRDNIEEPNGDAKTIYRC